MREIKFRAWDLVNKRFYELIETHVWELNHGEDYSVVYMQYTGLHDKNGKEIYEGDIVKEDGYEFPLWVVWADGCFNLISDAGHHSRLFGGPYGSDKLEVIGNIYENPEMVPK